MRTLVDSLGYILWPARCLVCDAPCSGTADGRDLCARCELNLPWNTVACPLCAAPLPLPAPACGNCLRRPPPLHGVRAAFLYARPIDRLLTMLKFDEGLPAARLLASLMHDTFAGAERPAALTPIPLHRQRLRERGYDQALELARPLARALRLPLFPNLLRRQRPSAPQSRLGRLERRRNVRDVFTVEGDHRPPDHLVLFDDVMTTGATLYSAARALRRAGVARIDAWVCARTPPPAH